MTTISASETHRSNITKNTLIYLIAQSISWLVSIVYVSVIWRKMGDMSTGQLALAGTTTGTLFGLLSLGSETYLVKEVGRTKEQSATIVGAVLGLRLVVLFSLIWFGICFLALA